jgi:multicomponent Na+:H+ antiporter subunit D
VYPLVRCALVLPEFDPIIRMFGVGTALLGVFYAIFEKDTKRMLAFSTLSQLGFILAAPVVGGFYALTHGLAKSALFLIAGNLPSRSFKELRQTSIDNKVWIALVIAGLSISGAPLLAGYGAKVLTMKNLLPWQAIALNVSAVGTAIVFAKFIFLPHGTSESDQPTIAKAVSSGFWPAMLLLLGGLIAANGDYFKAYTMDSLLKAGATIGIGWLIYLVVVQRITLKLPRQLEQFEHLVGFMLLILLPLFWLAVSAMEVV